MLCSEHFLLLYFSRSRQITQNILRLIQEYAQLDQNVLNDTHECYVLSVKNTHKKRKIWHFINLLWIGRSRWQLLLWAATGRDRPVPFTTGNNTFMSIKKHLCVLTLIPPTPRTAMFRRRRQFRHRGRRLLLPLPGDPAQAHHTGGHPAPTSL